MKRSGSVGLVMMGAAAFAATFAGGMAYFVWQKPSHAASAQAPGQSVAGQSCTTRADGTCEPQRRGFAYYFYPTSWVHGWSWGWRSSPESSRTQTAAFSNNAGTSASGPAAGSAATRGGFGGTASSGSFKVSAGG